MELNGMRVLVLGGTSGIGLAVATLATAEGAEVVVASSRTASVERAVALGMAGEVVDLADPAAVTSFVSGLGPTDQLVYTAGESLTLLPVAAMDHAAARAAFAVRYFGALAAVSAATIRPGGSITLTTGTAAERPLPGWSVASSICGAVVSLTRALAVELAPVRVNVVEPGLVASPLWSSLPDADREQMYADLGKAAPVGRVGEPAEVARAYLFLMTQGYATGSVVTVDGGSLLV